MNAASSLHQVKKSRVACEPLGNKNNVNPQQTVLTNKPPSTKQMFSVSNLSPAQWTSEDVITWLESVGLEAVVENFIDQEISGDILLHLDDDALKEIGIIRYGRRHKVMKALNDLKSSLVNEQIVPSNSNSSTRSTNSLCQGKTCASNANANAFNNDVHDNFSLEPSASSLTSEKELYSKAPNLSKTTAKENLMCHKSHCDNKRSLPSASITQSNPMSPSEGSNNMFKASATNLPKSTLPCKKNDINRRNIVPNLLPSTSVSTSSIHNMDANNNLPHEIYPERDGWMFKQSDRFKTWHKRWFALYDAELFYFKKSKDKRMKGVIYLQGYSVAFLESSHENNLNNKKKYGFKLQHERERTFYFYTSSPSETKYWVQALMKATIKRDLNVPTVSSNTNSTVALEVAQKMRPRPPSALMYGDIDRLQKYRETVKKDVLNTTLEEDFDETILFMEHPDQEEESYQKLIVQPYSSLDGNYATSSVGNVLQRDSEAFDESNLIRWVNTFLVHDQIQDFSQSFRSGEILIQLLESLSGTTVVHRYQPLQQRTFLSNMQMIENIVLAFKFMRYEGVLIDGYTINDVLSGRKERIVKMLYSIKAWAEENERALYTSF